MIPWMNRYFEFSDRFGMVRIIGRTIYITVDRSDVWFIPIEGYSGNISSDGNMSYSSAMDPFTFEVSDILWTYGWAFDNPYLDRATFKRRVELIYRFNRNHILHRQASFYRLTVPPVA